MTVESPERADAEPTGGEPDRTPARRPRSWTVVAPWVVTALALVLAGFSTTRWLDLRGRADTRADVAVAANGFLVDLVNWDASDGLDDAVAALRARGTGRFLAQVEDLFGGPVGDDLEVAEATSQGTVEDLFVQSIEDGQAEVFAVVSQGIDSTATSGTERSVRRVIMRFERVDGAWRIENLELPELVTRPPTGDRQG